MQPRCCNPQEVTVHLGNGLRRLHRDLRTFDLVLGNPPSYFAPDADGVLEDQSGSALRDDLRPSDPHWRTRYHFFKHIGPLVRPGALLLTHEVKPKDKVLYYQDVLLDFGGVFERRPEPLKDVAERLVERAGLDFVKWDMCEYTDRYSQGGEAMSHLCRLLVLRAPRAYSEDL